MTRWPVQSAMLLAALIAAWQPSKARAAEEDTQFWLTTVVTGPVGERTTLTMDASHRWRSDTAGTDQQTFRAMLDERIADRTRIGGGVMILEANGRTEFRLHQQAVFTMGRFDSRTRLEERFIEGTDRMELRLRQRLQYTHPLAENWRAATAVEWLGTIRSRDAGQGAATDQWRFQTSLTHRLSRSLEVGASYWLISFPRGDRPERITHVPQMTLTYRF